MSSDRALPRGTVTFLFTDIEGSTRLLEELRNVYADALAEHRRALREAFTAKGGVEVDTQGDAFFFAFERAKDAIAAAADAQLALAEGPIQVRIGIHTGEPIVNDEGYVGIDVHRAARIADAGHGGQVLLSGTTHDLLESSVELRDLGEHRLKDLSRPLRLYQLGGRDFPPLRTLDQVDLPVQLTPLIGRSRELQEAGALLREHRQLTLVGPGGCGKTRMALQLAAEHARDFEHGVFWVPLETLRDSELIQPTIARAVGAKGDLADHLRSKQVLLLLDNFEHVVEGSPRLAELLRAAPRVKVLVTSRSALRLSGEQEYPVPPLVEEDAVALFVERASSFDPAFERDDSVAEICRRLDGLPLAVELAAARVKALEPSAILARLEQRLDLLTGGPRDAPEHQRTLRATIEWSHDLLDASEQGLFAQLSVFAGGWLLEAAEEVCGTDLETLGRLIDKSLVRRESGRFRMLETVREYALERLEESGHGESMRERHASHFLALAETGGSTPVGGGEVETMEALEHEHDNFRASFAWLHAGGNVEAQLRLGVALGNYARVRGYAVEVLSWLEQALAGDKGEGPAELRLQALFWASNLAQRQGLERSAALAEECVALARSLDDDRLLGLPLTRLGNALTETDPQRARNALIESRSLHEKHGDRIGVAWATHSLGLNALTRGDDQEALLFLEESVKMFRECGSEGMIANALCDLGFVELRLRPERARAALTESLRLSMKVGWKEAAANCLVGMAGAARGDPELRTRLLGAASAASESAGIAIEPYGLAVQERAMAEARADLGEEAFAKAWEQGAQMELDEAVSLALAPAD
jgi:predicted ATPase/class 3 adenylate cyclase